MSEIPADMTHDQHAVRRQKLAELRAAGNDPFRAEFSTTHFSAEALNAYVDGHDNAVAVAVAGRLVTIRDMGKSQFAKILDQQGEIQLYIKKDVVGDDAYAAFRKLDLGDIVGAKGTLFKTKTGEITVRVESCTLLAKALRPLPEKWHGLADPETVYRQRYLDLVVNRASRSRLLLRSRVVSVIRRFLEDRKFIEVETPVFQAIAGGAAAKPFKTHHNALGVDFYLRISLELYLKRMLVGGIDRVFEMGRIFRNEGISRKHNPEFTMLELYQAYADYTDMMVIFEDIVSGTAEELFGATVLPYLGREIDLTPPWRRATLVELIAEHAGVELDLTMGLEQLRGIASGLGVPFEPWYGPGKLILEIYEKTTEAELWGPVFVCDYPQEVSPLARAHRSKPGWVERFEPIIAGRELGNAFSELVDPDDQRARFEEQERERALGDDEAMSIDWDYLRALELGLPPTGGLGMGIDRLVMLYADAANIREVVLFPALRPEERSTEAQADTTEL
jgi:lysyl-tRNA synthetase class 2